MILARTLILHLCSPYSHNNSLSNQELKWKMNIKVKECVTLNNIIYIYIYTYIYIYIYIIYIYIYYVDIDIVCLFQKCLPYIFNQKTFLKLQLYISTLCKSCSDFYFLQFLHYTPIVKWAKFSHHDFKGKFYAPAFSVFSGLPYKINVKISTQEGLLQLTFNFQKQLDR